MIKVRQDLTGRQFGRLTVIKRSKDHVYPNGRIVAQWLCECNCREDMKVIIINDNLLYGRTRSCGCLRSEMSSKRVKKHNLDRKLMFPI